MKTISMNDKTIKRNWYVIDARGKTLGRLASEVARRLRGKHRPDFTPHITGDYVIVINTQDIKVTGNKAKDKQYYWHTGYPGGIKSMSFEKMHAKDSRIIIEKAVKGMLPKNILGRQMYRQLKVYADSCHPHAAQRPIELKDF